MVYNHALDETVLVEIIKYFKSVSTIPDECMGVEVEISTTAM